MICERCGSMTMARTYDPDGKGTLPVCVACGWADYAGYYPVRLLPRFVTRTVVAGPTLRGMYIARFAKAIALFKDGFDVHAVAAELGVGIRQDAWTPTAEKVS